MLVLSRKVGEEVYLPELGVKVAVLKSKGGRTSLGVEAPDGVKILRGELPRNEDSFHSQPANQSCKYDTASLVSA